MSLVRTHRIRQGIFTMYLKRMNFPGGWGLHRLCLHSIFTQSETPTNLLHCSGVLRTCILNRNTIKIVHAIMLAFLY